MNDKASTEKPTPFRAALDPETDAMLDDYCEALDEANKTTVVRKAVRVYISNNLAKNDGMRSKFDELQQARPKRP